MTVAYRPVVKDNRFSTKFYPYKLELNNIILLCNAPLFDHYTGCPRTRGSNLVIPN
jgi:hypothetical protein